MTPGVVLHCSPHIRPDSCEWYMHYSLHHHVSGIAVLIGPDPCEWYCSPHDSCEWYCSLHDSCEWYCSLHIRLWLMWVVFLLSYQTTIRPGVKYWWLYLNQHDQVQVFSYTSQAQVQDTQHICQVQVLYQVQVQGKSTYVPSTSTVLDPRSDHDCEWYFSFHVGP